jgi:serine/threonine-protein kinase
MNVVSDGELCSDAIALKFLAGELGHAQEQAFVAHLDVCSVCRRRLDMSQDQKAVWDDARRLLGAAGLKTSISSSPPEGDAASDSKLSPEIRAVLSALGPTDDPQKLGRIGGYEVTGVVGAGGMGVVLKAIDMSLDRTVAIKVMAPHLASSGVARARFLREAKAAAAVLHPNVIAIYGVSAQQDLPYLVMPYIAGPSLQKRLETQGPLKLVEVLRIGAQIAAGLSASHAQGLVHRDIKPANILLEDGVERVTITDFGLARAVDDASITQTGTVAGTPAYMSPEQVRGEAIEPASDLFSLGCVLYAISTGRAPFRAETAYGTMRRIVDTSPPNLRALNPEAPEWFERLVLRLLEKDPQDRFSSAAELESLLRQCLLHIEQPLRVSLPDAVKNFQATPNRRKLARWTMGIGLTAIAAATWLFFAQISGNPNDSANRHETPSGGRQNAAISVPLKGSTDAAAYHISLLGAGDVSGLKHTTEFDVSRMQLHKTIHETSRNENNLLLKGGSGGAGGGSATTFVLPNLGIALKVSPLKKSTPAFVEVATAVKIVEADGKTTEAQDRGPGVLHFPDFEKQYEGAQYLYVHRDSAGEFNLKGVGGELLIAPGRMLQATFEGTTPKVQKIDGETISLESVSTSGNGIQISVRFPMTTLAKKAKTFQEQFEATIASQSAYFATIEDSDGGLHPATSGTNVGGEVQTTITTNMSSGKRSVVGKTGTPDNPSRVFNFDPLPSGTQIKAIHVVFKDRTSEANRVPFTIDVTPPSVR